MSKLGIQMFQQKISDITLQLDKIKEQGFDFIQLTPVQPTKEYNWEFWNVYQPISFSKIGNQYCKDENELKVFCDEAHKRGLKIVIDVVFGHVASKNNCYYEPNELVDEELKNPYFFKTKEKVRNWEDRWQCTNLNYGLACLDWKNYDLQDIEYNFLKKLIDLGADGFRLDALKHCSTDEDNHFFKRVINRIKEYKQDLFIYGEVIFTPNNIIDEYISKGISVLTTNSASDKSKLVTFIDSHDLLFEFKTSRHYTKELLEREWEVLLNSEREESHLFYVRPSKEYLDKYFAIKEGRVPYENADSFKIDSFDDTWKSDRIREINKKYSK